MTTPGDGRVLVHDIAALERTALAWERTAVSIGAVGALLLKVVRGGLLAQVAGLLLVATTIVVVLVMVPIGYYRARSEVLRHHPDATVRLQDPWRPRALLATCCVISLTGLLVASDLWWWSGAG